MLFFTWIVLKIKIHVPSLQHNKRYVVFMFSVNFREVSQLYYDSYDTYKYYQERRKTRAIIALSITVFILLIAFIGLVCLVFTLQNDGKIGVITTSGECKVDVIDTEGNSLIGDVLDFVAKEKENKIYFEPGSTYYTEGFTVKNIGTMPVNFHARISKDDDEDSLAFEEAFEFWITKDITNIKNADRLTSFSGSLDVNQTSETYYLVIKMKEEAGNEFQNKTYTGIGITVYAVQANADIEE